MQHELEKMTDEEEIEKINNMSQFEMCALWRFAPSGHKYFDSNLPFFEVFSNRLWKHFGHFRHYEFNNEIIDGIPTVEEI